MDTKNYESLKDPHLNEYFNNKRIRRHLIKAGFINHRGEILPVAKQEDMIARRTKRRQAKAKLSYTITNYIIEEERKRQMFFRNQFDLAMKRSRVQKIRESKYPPRRSRSHNVIYLAKHSKPRNARTPSPKLEKQSPIRPKSARYPVINVKNQAIRRPATSKQLLNDNICQVTMIYYGPQKTTELKKMNADEILVMQQHCGGENLIVFKGFVRPNETFTFDSYRHPDYPFALAIYINGLIDSRISVCCEYKHKHNVRLGSKYGLFGIYDVQKSQPCRGCRFEQRKKKIFSTISLERNPSPPYRRSILTSEFPLGALLRTPITSPEREKTPSKRATINRISTVVQASMSPRTLSSTSSHYESIKEEKSITPDRNIIINSQIETNDDSKNSSRLSSNTSKHSHRTSSDIFFKNEELHHSSEPILSKNDIHENSSEKSDRTPIHFSDDDDKLELEKENTNGYATRSSSSSDLSNSIALIKTNDNDVLSKSSSSTTLKRSNSLSLNLFSEKKDNSSELKSLSGNNEIEKSLSRTSSKNSKTSNLSYLKTKSNENIFSSNSSTPSNVNHLLVSDKKSDSSETIEDQRHRPSISSIDSQLTNDNISQTSPVKLDTDNQNIKTRKQNDNEEEILTTTIKSEKSPDRQYRTIENIILVWLDTNLDNPVNDIINSKIQLRQITRILRTYTDPNKCLELFKEIKNEKIFLIVSGHLSKIILEHIDDYPQVVIIYIFCQDKSKYEYLLKEYSKIKGIYTDILNICQQLKIDFKQWDNDLNTFQISSKMSLEFEFNSQQLLFIQNQLFKQYLLNIEYDENFKEDFIEYCQKLYIENNEEIQIIQQFNENYQSNNAIQWYIKDCFIYYILNRAIRTKDMKILFQIGFFIKDIHQIIENQYLETVHRSTLIVYRGQGMKMEYFNELKENLGGLLSFNGFVSTSKKQSIAYEFAQRSLTNGFPIAVIFRIKIDPKISSTPFININSLEFEILLSFKSIFSIEKIDEIENHLWQIDLILTDEIFPLIKIENDKYNDLNHHNNNYEKLGELLINMNEWNSAKDFYQINSTNNSIYIYKQLGFIYSKLNIYNQAILYYNLALQTNSNDYNMIANIYYEMGQIFYIQKRIFEALEKFQQSLNIQLEHLSSNDLLLNNTYNLLAMIYEENNDYETALDYYQNQLYIQEQIISTKQSDLALIHFKIAICLENLDRFDQAMDHIQKSIDMSSSDDIEFNERQIVLQRIREQLE